MSQKPAIIFDHENNEVLMRKDLYEKAKEEMYAVMGIPERLLKTQTQAANSYTTDKRIEGEDIKLRS